MKNKVRILDLEGGYRFAYMPYTDSDVSYVGVAVTAGTRHEQDNEEGLAHFVEHTVFKGTRHFSAKEINAEVERLGGDLNAYTTKEMTVFHATVLNQGVENALRVMTELTTCPTFPKDELRKEANIIVDEIQALNDSPDERLYEDIEAMIFNHSTMGRTILGSEQSVRGFTSDDTTRWVRTHFTPDNMTFFAMSSLPVQELADMINRLLPHDPTHVTNPQKDLVKSDIATCDQRPSHKVVNLHTHQAYLAMGCMAAGRLHDDFFPISLATNILGGPAISSWLYTALREEQGLAYNVDASYYAYSDTGSLIIGTATEPRYVDQCRDIIHQQMKRLRSISQTALDEAKLQLKGQIAISRENKEGRALDMAKRIALYKKNFTHNETREAIDRITIEDIHAVAERYFNPDNMHELLYK